MTPDLFWTLRGRQSAARGAIGRLLLPEAVAENPSFVGCVYAHPTVPTTMGNFVSVHPVFVSGTEGESSPGSLVVNSAVTVLVNVIGSQAPAAGDYLICRFVGHRWIAERMGSNQNTVSLYGCPCTEIPTTLHMSVNNPGLNYGIFQNTTLVYGPTPPEYLPLSIGDQSYLSPGSFTDQVTTDPFRYFFTCYSGNYVISRLYVHSVHGSPYRDIFYLYSWLIGLTGNTCSPFLLSFGDNSAGGNPSCVVTISE